MLLRTADRERDHTHFRFHTVFDLERKIDQAMRGRFDPDLQLEGGAIEAHLETAGARGLKLRGRGGLIKTMEIERQARIRGDKLNRNGTQKEIVRPNRKRADERTQNATR